jgi:hypothetical protein
MKGDKKIPEFSNYEEMAEFWDSHDLADYWGQTEPAEFGEPEGDGLIFSMAEVIRINENIKDILLKHTQKQTPEG